jgi:cupin superfamily acireductone dioxygenase involved in methionine salvage
MKHSIRCIVCNTFEKVNGQNAISTFVGKHTHGDDSARYTGKNFRLDIPEDRVNLKIDAKPLQTGKY